ncbi:MAG TPA: alanine racemase [Acidimicrobiia bacterium]|jgi:alanine racemase|nr:alanine racemase [Acidimicrobiia bacterium]
MVRPTYVEIDLGAVASNVAAFAGLISPSQVCAVVKADAYGHGDVPVANTALDSGADLLAVALVEEGIRLREAGIQAPVLVLSEPDLESARDLVEWDLTPSVYSATFVEALAATGARLAVHLKVDTGMHRVGAAPDEVDNLMKTVRQTPNLEVAALWTHFAVADEDPGYTRRQIEVFDEVAARYDVPLSHMANTAGAVLFPEARRSLCRIGLGTYGLHPCEETRDHVRLTPAMRLVTHVSHVQRLPAGERPSYGRVKELGEDSYVVTAPVGYADGLARSLTRYGSALIGGRRYPLAGTVTMDQIVINTGDDVHSIGDEVVLLGRQGDEEITADEWAEELGTISYEVICSIGPRVPRRYL